MVDKCQYCGRMVSPQRMKNVMIFCLGTLGELVKDGLVECDQGSDMLTEDGWKRHEELIAEGFEPTEMEVRIALAWYRNPDG